MKSYASRPRRTSGQFVKLATPAQKQLLRDLAKSSFLSKGHRINIYSALKRHVSLADASSEITRLLAMRRRADPAMN